MRSPTSQHFGHRQMLYSLHRAMVVLTLPMMCEEVNTPQGGESSGSA